LKLTAPDLKKFGIIDEIVPEPIGGAHMDFATSAENIKEALVRNMNELVKIPANKLIELRIRKFQNMGVYKE